MSHIQPECQEQSCDGQSCYYPDCMSRPSIRIDVNQTVGPGEVHFKVGGEVVGKIVNVGVETEKEQLDRDLAIYGVAFQVNGKRINPESVKVYYAPKLG